MKRPFLPALVTALTLALPVQAMDISQMSDSERAAFRAEVRAYLLENPELIMEAVAVLEARQSQQQEQSDLDLVKVNADSLFYDGHSWVGGNPEGDITLVEFMDYRCGYCRRAFDEVNELLKTDGNIRFIVKEFPILGEESVLASRFAIATQQVEGDDAYESVHDALMTFNGAINDTSLGRIADTLELNVSKIMAHMNSDEVNAVIAANHALGQRLSISGTPSFVMQDRMLRGYLPLDAMQQIAEEIRTQ